MATVGAHNCHLVQSHSSMPTSFQSAIESTGQHCLYCRKSTVYSHVMDITSPYCSVTKATDEMASLQLQTPHPMTVSTEGSDQLSSEGIPHLVQCTRQFWTALHNYALQYKSSSLTSMLTYSFTHYYIPHLIK